MENREAQPFIAQAGQGGVDKIAVPISECEELVARGLLCVECGFLLKDAVQTCEGFRLCQKCFDEIKELPGSKNKKTGICVLDPEDGDAMCFPDMAVRREIQSLNVMCSNKPSGCDFIGTAKEYYQDHVKSCMYQPKDCPNKEKGCMGKIPLSADDVLVHKHLTEECQFRTVCCQYCGAGTETVHHPLQEHYEACPMYPCKCDLCGNFTGTREQMSVHQEQCPKVKCVCGAILNKHGVDPSSMNFHLRTLECLKIRDSKHEREITSLRVRVSELELLLQASLASTHNGSFVWRIPEISRRKRDAIEDRVTSIYSPPFYTGRHGYKMCIRAYLDGDGMGYKTHLSLFFVLMKGEFDPLLKWPFENQASLILVDQNHRKHIVQTFKPEVGSISFQRPVSDMNIASGCPQFAKLAVLEDDNYVKDDVIFIKCIVDTTDIIHP